MRLPRRGLLGLAALAGLVTTPFAPQAAFAAYYGGEINHAVTLDHLPDDDYYAKCVTVSGAMACWQPYGDELFVHDDAADGHAVALVWDDLDSTRSGTCVSFSGKGYWGWCNKNLTEGHSVRFRAAVYESGSLVRQSGWAEIIT